MNRPRYIACILACAFVVSLAGAAAASICNQKEEEKIGRDYAKQIEQDLRMVSDPKITERVNRIGQALAKIAKETPLPAYYGSPERSNFNYQFKVIEDKEVNAFSLPSGIIYVNTGLLDMVSSDDELAGVLAHEIAHAAHHHMMQIARRQSTVDRYVALVTLAGILGNLRSNDLNNLLMGAQMMRTGKISGYTQKAEKDADRTAVAYLMKSKYNPEGLLTFMKKLDMKHDADPQLPLGIYEDHPPTFRRVAAIIKEMQAQGIKLDMRKLRDVAYAEAVPVKGIADKYEVMIGNKVLYTPACLDCGTTSKERAEEMAKSINLALDSGVTVKDIVEDRISGKLLAKGMEIVSVKPEDAKSVSTDQLALLYNAKKALAYAIWADWLSNDCQKLQNDANEELD